MPRLLSRAALAAAAAFALAACGYTTGSLVPDGYRTIAVPIFANETRRHDLEWEVTRAVVEEIQARTPLRVVDRDQSPDLTLSGVLRDVDESVSSRLARQRIRESDVFVSADVTITDRKSGKTLVEKQRVTEREAFVPELGEDVRTARQEAVRALAERIARTLESAW
jgi:hypothetical protein